MTVLVLDLALKASVLLVLAVVAIVLDRRAAAAHRHFVWTLTLAGLLALPLLVLALPWRLPIVAVPERLAPATAARAPRVPAGPTTAALTPSAPVGVAAAREPPPASNPAEASAAAPPWAWTPAGIAAVLWLAGLCVALARIGVAAALVRWVLRSAREVTDPAWRSALAAAATRLGLRGPVRLVESLQANVPMAFGVRRPVVILPMEAAGWSAELRELVLLHELAHVRRRDVVANLVGQLTCALYWFHPLVWAAARRLRIEAERACDDLVLGAGATASAYAGHLLAMVQAASRLRAPALAVPMAQRSAFEGRVLAILEPNVARHGLSRGAAALGAVALLGVAVPLAALSPARPAVPSRSATPTAPAAFERSPAASAAVADGGATSRDLVDVSAPGPVPDPDPDPKQDRAGDPPLLPSGGPVTLGLVAALGDADASVRLAAAQALGERGDTAAINALLAALRRDTSRDVRLAAAHALGEIEDARAVPGLLAALREERDREVRHQVVWALGEIESADAVDGLGAALRGETDREIRRLIVWALGEIESAEAVPQLAALLRDPDEELRRQAVWALGEIESPAAVDPLVAMLGQERVVETREMIVWALGEIEDRRAAPALEAALRDTSVAIRRKAAWALGELDDLRAAPAGLISALRDADVEVRRAAAHALGEIEDPASVPGLVGALRDGDLDVRRGVVAALGEIRSTAAIEALVVALRDEDPEIRRLAAQALGNR